MTQGDTQAECKHTHERGAWERAVIRSEDSKNREYCRREGVPNSYSETCI
jgi:hypothetical protein